MLALPTFPAPLELHTRRCALRQWKDADLAPWAAMNADPAVRRYFPSLLDAKQAAAEAARCRALPRAAAKPSHSAAGAYGRWKFPANFLSPVSSD